MLCKQNRSSRLSQKALVVAMPSCSVLYRVVRAHGAHKRRYRVLRNGARVELIYFVERTLPTKGRKAVATLGVSQLYIHRQSINKRTQVTLPYLTTI